MKAGAPLASFSKSYSDGSLYEFAKSVHFLSSVAAFAELTYNPISLSLQTAENWVWIDLKHPQLRLCGAVISRGAGTVAGQGMQ